MVGTSMETMTNVAVVYTVSPRGNAGVTNKIKANTIMATITEIKAINKSVRIFIMFKTPETVVL